MNKNIKNILLIILILVVISIAVGYGALAQVLTINGTANITASWDVKINNIAEGTLNGAVSKTAAVVAGDKLSATFDVELQYPGANATYLVTVENAGTIPAKLESVTNLDTINNSTPTDITFSIDANADDLLDAGNTKVYTVTAKWGDSNQIPTVKSKTVTIALNYVQAI